MSPPEPPRTSCPSPPAQASPCISPHQEKCSCSPADLFYGPREWEHLLKASIAHFSACSQTWGLCAYFFLTSNPALCASSSSVSVSAEHDDVHCRLLVMVDHPNENAQAALCQELQPEVMPSLMWHHAQCNWLPGHQGGRHLKSFAWLPYYMLQTS